MTDSSRTLDPRAREDLIGHSIRRLFGPVPTVEFIPPEGSTETEPPYGSAEIRYWKVVDGVRQRRHRRLFDALYDPEARSRLAQASSGVRRRAFIGTGFAVLIFCFVLFVAGGVGAEMVEDASLSAAILVAGALAWIIVAVGPFCFFVRRMLGRLWDGRFRASLSQDEWGLLVHLTLPPVLAAYLAALGLSMPVIRLVLAAFGLEAG